MEQLFNTLITSIPEQALPIVVVVIACFYIYRKIGKDRAETKELRDKDSLAIHDKLLSHDFQITELKGRTELHDELLSDINKQISVLNTNLAVLTEKIDNLTNIIKEVRNER